MKKKKKKKKKQQQQQSASAADAWDALVVVSGLGSQRRLRGKGGAGVLRHFSLVEIVRVLLGERVHGLWRAAARQVPSASAPNAPCAAASVRLTSDDGCMASTASAAVPSASLDSILEYCALLAAMWRARPRKFTGSAGAESATESNRSTLWGSRTRAAAARTREGIWRGESQSESEAGPIAAAGAGRAISHAIGDGMDW
eukprot:scaffold1850_cov194-Pinguiococcus_pyrenoidosus.AAC.30